MSPNKWYVITGGPATGKTTLLAALAKRGHLTVPEAARAVVDQGRAKGLTIQDIRKDEQKFQENVTRLKAEREVAADPSVLTFFDRGMHDTWAYLVVGPYKIAPWVEELLQSSRYQKVFLLEPLPEYEHDYARNEDETKRQQLQKLLKEAYTRHGMEVIHIPVMPVEERADFILSQL